MIEMTPRIDLRPDHLEIVCKILREHVPDIGVLAFGSRATWTAKEYSDLDLAVLGDEPLPLEITSALTERFSESDLPFKVDLVDWATTNPSFRKIIRRDGISVQVSVRRSNHRKGPYGPIAKHYRETTLKNLCVPGNGIQTGPFGSQLHQRDYVDDGAPIITVEHLNENRIVHRNLPRVSYKDKKRLSKYCLRLGDIVFSRVGSVDRRALVRTTEEGWLFSGRCLRVRPNPEYIDSIWLSYFFGLAGFRHYIRSIAVGATMPSLNTQLLSDVIVPYPPLTEQRATAHILSTLDDKIELNRRMNKTLEEMAQALFKSWFVDFDPVCAKMEGRDTGLPKHIDELFPDTVMNSKFGEVPKGWETVSLSEIIDLNPKRTLRKGQVAPYLDMASMPTKGHIPHKWTDRPYGSGMRFTNGDTLLARITPCLENGKTAYVDFLPSGNIGWGSTEYIVMRTKPWIPNEYAYCLARSPDFREFAIHNMTGTSGRQRVPAKALAYFPLVAPSKDVVEAFGRLIRPLFTQASENALESRTLTTMRDTLLPKLITGQIRLREAETVTEAVL